MSSCGTDGPLCGHPSDGRPRPRPRPRTLHTRVLQEAGGEPVLRRGPLGQVRHPLRGEESPAPRTSQSGGSPRHRLSLTLVRSGPSKCLRC